LRAVLIYRRTARRTGPPIDLAEADRLPQFARLVRLHTSGPIMTGGATALARAGGARYLRSLRVHDSGLGQAELQALCAAPWAAGVAELALTGAHPTPRPDRPLGEAVCAVAASPYLANLRRLDLSGNRLRDADALVLAYSRNLARVWRLDLAHTGLGPVAAGWLARSPVLARLRALCLDGTNVGDLGLEALLAAHWFAGLQELGLCAAGVSDAGVVDLATSPGVAGVRRLWLGGNAIGDRGARALAGSPFLGGLEVLTLDGRQLTRAGVQALQARFRGRVLIWR
jgi:hypothetical protein